MPESSTQVNMVPPWGCSICLENAKDPVCTSCGHIFCWPCLYPWVHDMGKPCPVCRTHLSVHSNIVAVYASPAAQSSGEGNSGIPPRPHPAVFHPPSQPPRRRHYFAGDDESRRVSDSVAASSSNPPRPHHFAGEPHRVVVANRSVPPHPHQVTRPPPHGPIRVVPPQPWHLVSIPPEGPYLLIDPPRQPPRQTHFGAARELQFRLRVRDRLQRSIEELEELRNAELEQHRVTSRRRSHATRLSSHMEQRH